MGYAVTQHPRWVLGGHTDRLAGCGFDSRTVLLWLATLARQPLVVLMSESDPTCPVCGEPCLEIGGWLDSKADDSDEFRTIVHDRSGAIVIESCIETR